MSRNYDIYFYNIYLFDYLFIFCKKKKIYIVTFDKFNA